MLQFIIKRIFQLIPVLIGISLITFTLLFVVVPGDPARAIAGQKAEEETLERIREKWHLNDAKFFAVKIEWRERTTERGDKLADDYTNTATASGVEGYVLNRFVMRFLP